MSKPSKLRGGRYFWARYETWQPTGNQKSIR